MEELAIGVTMKGSPVKVYGYDVQVGESAPNCTLTANDMSSFELSSLKGKKVILLTVPSLDTAVCDVEIKRFNSEAAKLGKEIQIIVVSMDLPFAQKRWCAQTGSDQVKTLSDYKEAILGQSYGVLLKDMRLLARAAFVVDKDGVLRYKQIVPEIAQEPNYNEILQAVKNLK